MADVLAFAEGCFTGSPGDQVGVELEFLVHDVTDPALTVPIARVTDALGGLTLPGGSVITFEPGGQIELSAPPGSLPVAVAALQRDVGLVRSALGAAGLALGRSGVDGHRRPLRQLHTPRYDAMAACLGEPYGPLMMCSTASIQVNLDFGADPFARWRRAHLFGPVLVAAFANSPGPVPGFESWLSGRQAIWLALDPSRTAPVGGDPAGASQPIPDQSYGTFTGAGREPGHSCVACDGSDEGLLGPVPVVESRSGSCSVCDGSGQHVAGSGPIDRAADSGLGCSCVLSDAVPAESASLKAAGMVDVPGRGYPPSDWAAYLQAARLMLVREPDASVRQMGAGAHRFRDFHLAAGRSPTVDDLAYHATTLFPAVRPRGFMEIRYLDALGPVAWPVAVAVSYALVIDDEAAAAAAEDALAVAGQWAEAARCGLASPAMRRAAVAAFRAAITALPRCGAPQSLIDQVTDYAVRFVEPGRSPAADLLLESR
ncbi:glutamate-cysteine ligase family protein [Herbidospora mongoliensis]|uniref:glutamate-cysteine ligase family protein n=1 Tax=Herbidospora mongoliensis TaxID=688067 RepID=UPI000AF23649|nr:glutamate-cysteine ligase family protein [Herbidospora mongoliensis]